MPRPAGERSVTLDDSLNGVGTVAMLRKHRAAVDVDPPSAVVRPSPATPATPPGDRMSATATRARGEVSFERGETASGVAARADHNEDDDKQREEEDERVQAVPFARRGTRSLQRVRSVTVGSFNVHWGRRPAGPRKGEPYDVVEACRRLDVDVLALQEVWRRDGGPSVAEEVAADLGYDVHHVWTARAIVKPKCEIVSRADGTDGDGDWGQALLTRVPTDEVTEHRLSGFLMDATDRAVLRTGIDLDGTTLTVCASHLPHLEHMSPLLRWRLRSVLPEAQEPGVLMGDFNMWRWVARFIVPGWTDTVRGATWPAHRLPVFQIDHLLATPPVLATDTEVVHAGESDHLPIRARVSLR